MSLSSCTWPSPATVWLGEQANHCSQRRPLSVHTGLGEPQHQLVPALFDVLVAKLKQLPQVEQSDEPPETVSFLIKSDGMGKQKNIGLRACYLIDEALEEFHVIEHDRELAKTTAEWRGYTIEITVCINLHFAHRHQS